MDDRFVDERVAFGCLPIGMEVRATRSMIVRGLYPEEATTVSRATERRRAEFATGRHLARVALTDLGFPSGPIGTGANRQPLWPPGTVGSITHCDGFTAVALAIAADYVGIGIDAEPTSRHLGADVARRVCSRDELRQSECLGLIGPLLIFSAKESIYKAWFSATSRKLQFADVTVELSAEPGIFNWKAPSRDQAPPIRNGCWHINGGLLTTAVAMVDLKSRNSH